MGSMASSDILRRLVFAATTQFHAILARSFFLVRAGAARGAPTLRDGAGAVRLMIAVAIAAPAAFALQYARLLRRIARLTRASLLAWQNAPKALHPVASMQACVPQSPSRGPCGECGGINRGPAARMKSNGGHARGAWRGSGGDVQDISSHLFPIFPRRSGRPFPVLRLHFPNSRRRFFRAHERGCDILTHVAMGRSRSGLRRKVNLLLICLGILHKRGRCASFAGSGIIRGGFWLKSPSML